MGFIYCLQRQKPKKSPKRVLKKIHGGICSEMVVFKNKFHHEKTGSFLDLKYHLQESSEDPISHSLLLTLLVKIPFTLTLSY
jgi:hypothetical protein